MGTKIQQNKTLNSICEKARIFVPETIHKNDALDVLAKLDASKPNPFTHETKTAKITFERYQFSNPREPEEFISFSLVIEATQRQSPAGSPSHVKPS
jgi:hypothetical protein